MMLKERSKLSIVAAFIVGTTMLSSVDNAWGMDDQNDLIGSFFVVKSARVSPKTLQIAKELLKTTKTKTSFFTGNKKPDLDIRKKTFENLLVGKNKDLFKDLFIRELANVVYDLSQPLSALNKLVPQSLEIIISATEEDPCGKLIGGESKPVFSPEEMDSLKKSLQEEKEKGTLSNFFSTNLSNFPNSSVIVESLIARFPRDEEKIETLINSLRTYFGQPITGATKKPAPKTTQELQRLMKEKKDLETKLNKERAAKFDKNLAILAESYYILKQINDRHTPPVLTTSSSTPALVESDSKIVTSDFHMGEPNSYAISGFSVFRPTHRWTLGNKAVVVLPLERMEPRPIGISFLHTGGFVTPTYGQNLNVTMNGDNAGWYFYTPDTNDQTIDIELPKIGPATIEFNIPDAISPSDLGVSPDKRALGISFGPVEFKFN